MKFKKHKIQIKDPTTGKFSEIEMLGNSAKQDIETWLDEHPEATTTVEANSITAEKLSENLRKKVTSKVEYVFPRNFGASVRDGDCNLIVADGINILIDSHREIAYSQVKTFLEDNEVTHLDYFILSHYHADHYENIRFLITDGFIDTNTVVYLPPQGDYFSRISGTNFITGANLVNEWLSNANITPIFPSEWDSFYPSSTVKITFYNCDANVFNESTWSTAYNECSMLCLVEHGKNATLYTGDAYNMALNRALQNGFIDRHIDLYKINHHGINAVDNVYTFLTRINPTYAVQPSSLGDDLINNHDKNVEMQTLQLLGCKIFQSHANEKDIIFESTVDSITVTQGLSTAYGGAHTQTQTYYVDASTTANIQDGTSTYPFKDLSQALSHCMSSAPIIYQFRLSPGTYNESHETAAKNKFRSSCCRIYLYGDSQNQNNVIIKNGFEIFDCTLYAEYITFDCTVSACNISGGMVRFEHCTFTGNTGSGNQLEFRFGARGLIGGSTRFEDFVTAISVSTASSLIYSSMYFNNGTTGISVSNGGLITEIYRSCTFTNVTTPVALSDYANFNGTGRNIYETEKTTQTFTGRNNRAGLIFIINGNNINEYFWNVSSNTILVKTLVEQITNSPVTYTINGLNVVFTSSSNITMFARDF